MVRVDRYEVDGMLYTAWLCPRDRGLVSMVKRRTPISKLDLEGFRYFHVARIGGHDPIQLEASSSDGSMKIRLKLDVNQVKYIIHIIENGLAGKDTDASPVYYVTKLELSKVNNGHDKWKLEFQALPWWMTRYEISAVYTVVSFIFSANYDIRKLLSELKKAASHHVRCPACDGWFGNWFDIADHWVSGDPNHHKLIKKLTGNGHALYDNTESIRELAALLKKSYRHARKK